MIYAGRIGFCACLGAARVPHSGPTLPVPCPTSNVGPGKTWLSYIEMLKDGAKKTFSASVRTPKHGKSLKNHVRAFVIQGGAGLGKGVDTERN